MRILIVDDDDFYVRAIEQLLPACDQNVSVDAVYRGEDAVPRIAADVYDCVLLDYALPGLDGLEVLDRIRSAAVAEGAASPPVIMQTGTGNEQVAVEAMKRGAADYVVKGMTEPDSLLSSIRHAVAEARRQHEAAEAYTRLQSMALTDPVTGLGNRHRFESEFDHALRRSRRTGERLCLMIIDLDRFKALNDAHGHHVGDAALAETGRRIATLVRDSDRAVRLGGDEFAVLMESGATAEGAGTLAERLSESIRRPIRIDGIDVCVGASIGYALYPDHGETTDALMRHADNAMYAAKRAETRERRSPAVVSFNPHDDMPETTAEHQFRLQRAT